MPCVSRQAKITNKFLSACGVPIAWRGRDYWKLCTLVVPFLKPLTPPFGVHQPHHAMSVTQRTWLAFCVTAILVTNSMCWPF